MKSSHQLKQCLKFPEPLGREEGPAYTRTMLLAQRRVENATAERLGHERFLRNTGQALE